MNDAELRQLYAGMLARRTPATRERCVPLDLLRAIAEGDASGADRIEALRHVAACGDCRADLDLLRSVVEAAQGTVGQPGPRPGVAGGGEEPLHPPPAPPLS